jgi:hypothetical protein
MIEQLAPIVIAGTILSSLMSLTAVLTGRQAPSEGPGRTVTVTIEDPSGGVSRTVARSTRRAELIRRDVERAIREGC